MPVSTAGFSQLLAPGLMAVTMTKLEEFAPEYPSFCALEATERAYEEDQEMIGLGIAVLKGDGAPITYDEPRMGASKRITNEEYAMGVSFTSRIIEDDLYGVIKQIPSELTGSLTWIMEQVAANALNLGFSTMTVNDGLSFFNTAHTMSDGSVQSNQLASNPDLSVTALQDMVIAAETYTNQRGRKRKLMIKDIFIHPQLRFIADNIQKAQGILGSNANDINTMQGMFTYHTLHYLTSQSAWFARASNVDNYLKFVTRKKPVSESSNDFDTGGLKHKMNCRFGVQATRHPGWFASTGLGA